MAALRAAGASVLHLHEVGSGCPDLLIGIAGKDCLAEVKNPKPGANAVDLLNGLQVEFHRTWRGRKVVLLTSARQAFEFARELAGGSR